MHYGDKASVRAQLGLIDVTTLPVWLAPDLPGRRLTIAPATRSSAAPHWCENGPMTQPPSLSPS